jgi:GDP-4-dehydro-6-deoxy-D-mannose reductase
VQNSPLRTALVTGAEGFIGSHLVRHLQTSGWNVVGSCLSSAESSSQIPGVRLVECDLRDAERVAWLLAQYAPTHVFHLGAQSSPARSRLDPVETFESNVLGSLHLLEAVRRQPRPPLVVLACSSAEYGHVGRSAIPTRETQALEPLHPYGISKVCLDLMSRYYFLDCGVRTVRLRVFNTTGPGKINDAPSDFIRQLVRIKQGRQPAVVTTGNLSPRRAFLDVRDAVKGLHLAALRGKAGEVYNLCAPRTYTIRGLLKTAMRLAGVQARIQTSPRLLRPHDEKIIFGSSEKFSRRTGWKPAEQLEGTLVSMLRYWSERNDSPRTESGAK